jgi:hypothetical protein
MPQQFAPCHLADLEDRFVDVQLVMRWRRLIDESAYAADDVAGSSTVLDDGTDGPAGFRLQRVTYEGRSTTARHREVSQI